MKIAVTGPSGQLGSELVRRGCMPLRGRLMSEEMTTNIETINPDAIINCAAMTNVDACEHEPLMAAASNMAGVEYLSRYFKGYLIQISTDYVFDGKTGPYWVGATPNPINIYGWAKMGGELIAKRHKGPSLIIRTTVLFSNANNNFVSKIIDQLAAGKQVKLYNPNIVGTPTYVPTLTTEIMRLVKEGYTGLAHVAGQRALTRLSFAEMIAEIFGYDPKLIVPTDDILVGAARPEFAGLICDHTGYGKVNTHNSIEGLKELAKQRGL